MHGQWPSQIFQRIPSTSAIDRYINNSLPTGQTLVRWNLSPTSDCHSCLLPESLLHIVAGCQSYLKRFTWRHDSILNFLAKTLMCVNNSKLFVDLPEYRSPSISPETNTVLTCSW